MTANTSEQHACFTHSEMLEECAMEPRYRIESEGDEIKIFRWMVTGGNLPATKSAQKDRDREIALYWFGWGQIYNGSFAEMERIYLRCRHLHESETRKKR
jgi:hypothetical protein